MPVTIGHTIEFVNRTVTSATAAPIHSFVPPAITAGTMKLTNSGEPRLIFVAPKRVPSAFPRKRH